ncbi:MAG: DUF2723 domain-containing protein [Anaerolineae bacterium]|nr:DUF2723 domain-containing protein [Anaerolineae bacterium]
MSTLNRNLPLTTRSAQPLSLTIGWVRHGFWVAAAAFLPLLLYLRTMAPTVYGLDSAELTTGAYTLGIVHPPGSPLYLLIAHLFTWLPLGDVGYRVNLFSVLSGSVAAAFLYLILHQLTRSRWVALGVAWFAAASYYIWISALAAELYAPQGAWLVGLLWLALRWQQERQPWQLPVLTFLFGLGLGIHLSLILLLPGLALLLLGGNTRNLPGMGENFRQLPRPMLLIAAATGILGSLIYLYLPLRYGDSDSLNYAQLYWGIDLTTWRGFWWMVSGRIFGSLFLGVPLAQLPAELMTFLHQLWSNYLGLGLLLGLIGLLSDFRRRPVLHLSLLLMFLAHVGFYLTYRVIDKQFMFIPAYLIWAIWVGLGVMGLHQWISRQDRQLPTANLSPIMPTVLFMLVAAAFWLNYPLADVSQDDSARRRGETLFTTLPNGVVFYGTWADVPILEYLQYVEGERPDILTRNLVFVGRQRADEEVQHRLDAGQTVYTSRPDWFAEELFTFTRLERCGCFAITVGE